MRTLSSMKGVILAGGKGTRLQPVTQVINKHLLPVYDRPMIFFPLQMLAGCGIQDILLISSPEHINDFITILGDGKDFGVSLRYEIQDQPHGIADALFHAKNFIGEHKMMVMLGDNILFNPPLSEVQQFHFQKNGAYIFLKRIKDPHYFGIVNFAKNKHILSIVEKPKLPLSHMAVIGMYMYNPDVFDIIEKLTPSKRGELEITDVNNYYAHKGNLEYQVLKGSWIDAGSSFMSLFQASSMVSKKYHSINRNKQDA